MKRLVFFNTQIEGDPDTVWKVVRDAFEASLASGASKQLMILKVSASGHSADALEASGRKAAEAK